MENNNIIEVKDLKINIKIDEGTLTAVRGVDFEIKKGETSEISINGWMTDGSAISDKAEVSYKPEDAEIISIDDSLGITTSKTLNRTDVGR